jgi:Protein of unknown function (DUF4230)
MADDDRHPGRDRDREHNHEPRREVGGRRRPWLGYALAAVAGAVAIALLAVGLVGLVPRLNPFGTDTIDRSSPALLQSIRDLSQYHAAVGDFQVVVDVEKDVRFVPSIIAGERSLFVANGTVDAYVDFSGLSEDKLRVNEEAKTVEIRLPDAALAKPNLDPEHSYLFGQQRGVVNRINDLISPPDQHEFYVAAEQKIAEAAEASELKSRAEQNTRAMLTGMMQSLGYQVSFGPDDS